MSECEEEYEGGARFVSNYLGSTRPRGLETLSSEYWIGRILFPVMQPKVDLQTFQQKDEECSEYSSKMQMTNWCLIKAQPGCSLKMMIKSCFLWSWDIQQAKCHHGWLLVKDNLTKMVPDDHEWRRESPEVTIALSIMIDNIGLRILTSRSFSRDNDNTTDSGGTRGRNDMDTLCLLNYVGVGDTEYRIYFLSHLLKHLENISGGQSIINWSPACHVIFYIWSHFSIKETLVIIVHVLIKVLDNPFFALPPVSHLVWCQCHNNTWAVCKMNLFLRTTQCSSNVQRQLEPVSCHAAAVTSMSHFLTSLWESHHILFSHKMWWIKDGQFLHTTATVPRWVQGSHCYCCLDFVTLNHTSDLRSLRNQDHDHHGQCPKVCLLARK